MMVLLIILTAVLAFYVAWNLGANDVANSMGTSVGSKAITLHQAVILAGILEFTGAVVFGQDVASTIATKIVNPDLFANNPTWLLWGMIAVLISCGIWLQIATSQGLPVASSHAIIGAIAGMSFVQGGIRAVNWHNLALISLTWIITPLISGLIAIIFYRLIQQGILLQKDTLAQLKEWIPWLAFLLFSIFGIIVFPTLFQTPFLQQIILLLSHHFGVFPEHDLGLILGGIAIFCLTINTWNLLYTSSPENNDNFAPPIVEKVLGRFQVMSAAFVAFAHGSNDVGNAIAPLAVIVYILRTNHLPNGSLTFPSWILILGGLGIVTGLALQGKKVITTVGEGIIPLQPSKGFSAEIATAITILIASKLGFPVSTSHTLIGSVVGIGLIQNQEKLQFETIKSIILAWFVTLPITAIIGAISFLILGLF